MYVISLALTGALLVQYGEFCVLVGMCRSEMFVLFLWKVMVLHILKLQNYE